MEGDSEAQIRPKRIWFVKEDGEWKKKVVETEGDYKEEYGLLTRVKKDAEVHDVNLTKDDIREAVGRMGETLLIKWAKRNEKEVLKPYVHDDWNNVKVRTSVPDRYNKCANLHLSNIRCDLFFLIDQPSVGTSFVMFEAKTGSAGISHNQAQYFKTAHDSPSEVVNGASEGHVVLAKCFDWDLDNEEMAFYIGELIVPAKEGPFDNFGDLELEGEKEVNP